MFVLAALLLALGAALLIAEAHVASAGVLGGLGIAALVAGLATALHAGGAGLGVAIGLAAIVGVAAAGTLVRVLPAAYATRRRRVRTGPQGLLGEVGVLRCEPEQRAARVFVSGALWNARIADADADSSDSSPHAGDRVVVEAVHGLTLSVRKAEEWELSP